MQITVTQPEGGVYALDVSGELTLRDLKALLEVETGLEAGEMLLVHNMAPMTDDLKMLEEYDVQDGDIIMVSQHSGAVTLSNPPTPDSQAHSVPPHYPLPSHNQLSSQLPSQPLPQARGGSASGRRQGTSSGQGTASGRGTATGGGGSFPAIDWSSVNLPGLSSSGTTNPSAANPDAENPPGQRHSDDPDTVRQYFLSNPYELAMLQQRNPPLAEALLSGDPQRFRDALHRHQMAVRDMERQRIRMINADPFDPEYQAKIAQDIQQKNIDENMEAALEYTPESFSRVVMLYINCKVNGVAVKALVDSGARSTVMSAACAERCNIMRLVDKRFAGVAFGVGTQKIIGRVHLGQIQIGNNFLASSFQVLENQSEDMLLGLDMLRRHLCCIDLEHNVLRFGTSGSEAPFLTEKDLHEKEEMEKKQAALSMETEDAEMAKAIAKSELEEHEKRNQRRGGDRGDIGRSTSSLPSQPPRHSPPPSSSPSQPLPQPQFPEASIQRITSAGFTREQAVEELQQCSGNPDLALASLLAKSIQF